MKFDFGTCDHSLKLCRRYARWYEQHPRDKAPPMESLIVLLPFVGALIYWTVRKPSRDDVEQAYLGEAALRRSRAARPFDSTGL